jgi:hypothetical protein
LIGLRQSHLAACGESRHSDAAKDSLVINAVAGIGAGVSSLIGQKAACTDMQHDLWAA